MMNIINFIQAMDYVVPGFASYETLLYSPELKFYSNRVKMDTDFNTSLQGLHCLGDSSGWDPGADDGVHHGRPHGPQDRRRGLKTESKQTAGAFDAPAASVNKTEF